MKNTTHMTMTTFPYFSGNRALGCDPTPGIWDGDKFTALDGGEWTVEPSDASPHPAVDGTDTHYLIPA
jgi:hypothetical protein